MSDAVLLGFLAVSLIGGMWAIHKTGVDLGVCDHGSIVWDEIVPFWLVLLFCPAAWLWQSAAFVLFRLFDIFKPQPARYFDQHVKNGFGVMADDSPSTRLVSSSDARQFRWVRLILLIT